MLSAGLIKLLATNNTWKSSLVLLPTNTSMKAQPLLPEREREERRERERDRERERERERERGRERDRGKEREWEGIERERKRREINNL